MGKWLKNGGPPAKREVDPAMLAIDERWAERHHACSVDDDVDTAARPVGLVEELGDGVLIGNIGGDATHAPAAPILHPLPRPAGAARTDTS